MSHSSATIVREVLVQLRPIDIPCPKCHAQPGEKCVSENHKRLNEVHLARIEAARLQSPTEP